MLGHVVEATRRPQYPLDDGGLQALLPAPALQGARFKLLGPDELLRFERSARRVQHAGAVVEQLSADLSRRTEGPNAQSDLLLQEIDRKGPAAPGSHELQTFVCAVTRFSPP